MRTLGAVVILVPVIWGTGLHAQDATQGLAALRSASAQQLASTYRDVSWHIMVLQLAGDGGTVVLGGLTVTDANVDAVRSDLERRRADLAAAITERGYAALAGRYRAEVESACRIPSWWTAAIQQGTAVDVTIVQDSFAIQLVQEGLPEIAAVVVDSAIAFHDPGNSDFGFVGTVTPNGIVVQPEVDRILEAWPRDIPAPKRRDLSQCAVRLARQL